MSNKAYFLALNRIDHVGPRTVAKLLRRWPALEELFQLKQQALTKAGLPEKTAAAIVTFNKHALDADWRWQESSEHHLLTWEDEAYPALLKEIPDPPIVLYAIGALASLHSRTIAMVGSRKPTVMGRETASRLAFDLAKHHTTIVSGLASGIDAAAHQGTLKAGGKTIAVMATGIDTIYPKQHRALADSISQNGLLLTEFPLKTPPIAGHFPRRNRIISGLSLATLVVEAAMRSGSLITARLALEQNREVLAIPGSIYNPESRGCHYLLQQGAKLVTCSEDVLEELPKSRGNSFIEESILALASENRNLVQCIGFELTSVDTIVGRSGLCMETVICGLAELELQGIVVAVPGGYMRCT